MSEVRCNCGFGGFHEPLNRRCEAFDPNHPDVASTPASSGGEGLSQEERRSLGCQCWVGHHLRDCPVPAVERILAVRQPVGIERVEWSYEAANGTRAYCSEEIARAVAKGNAEGYTCGVARVPLVRAYRRTVIAYEPIVTTFEPVVGEWEVVDE